MSGNEVIALAILVGGPLASGLLAIWLYLRMERKDRP